jgi:hypothetical protein
MDPIRPLSHGALAGAFSALTFTWAHDLLISDIWFSLPIMMIAGAACGACLAWTFDLLIEIPSTSLNGPPGDLIEQALPMTILSTLAMAGIISRIYARSWQQFGAVLLTCAVLVILLGLNVSVIGLVSIPRGAFYLVAEMFGLIVILALVFSVAYLVFKQLRLFSTEH